MKRATLNEPPNKNVHRAPAEESVLNLRCMWQKSGGCLM